MSAMRRSEGKRSAVSHVQRLEILKQRRREGHAAEFEAMRRGRMPITSTRLGEPGSDAYRDMDGFDPDEELLRFEPCLSGFLPKRSHVADLRAPEEK